MERLSGWVIRHRMMVGLLWLAITVVGVVVAPSLSGHLKNGVHVDTAAYAANQQIARQCGGVTSDPGVLVINFPHGQTAASAGVQAELRAFDARVAKASPGLREVSYASTGSRVLLGTGGKSTIVLVYPPRAGTDLPASVLSQLAAAARTAVPGAAVHSTGLSALSTSGAAAAHSSVLSELALGAITAGNPGHLERLFRNIIDNAIRFARARVVIRATSAETTVQVEVIDDGPGIPAAERDRVFDRFVRLDTSRERRTGTPGWGWQSPARSL